jgi:two-component system heavy metal sensor histidine kinase CusS
MPRSRRWSLAWRLTAWYAATAFMLVAAAAFMQYRTLVSNLDDGDEQILRAQLAAARATRPDSALPPADPHDPSVVVRRLDRTCRVPAGGAPAATGAGPAADELPPPACELDSEDEVQLHSWRSPKGRSWLIASARAGTPDSAWIEALLDRSRNRAVLRSYREQLALVLSAALLLAVLVGYGIARRGLRPLAELRDRVSRIDARSLDQRLHSRDAPAEIAALVASFDAMLGRLDAAFRALSELSAELAHELRTPLHVLRQQAEVALGRARTPEEYGEVLSSSLEELDRLGRMADDMLFLARAEDPRASINRTPLDVDAELRDVVEYLDVVAAERGVRLVIAPHEELRLEADHTLLRRALVNLVMNAIRHTPAGGEVRLTAWRTPDAVVVAVEDTGEGIPPEVLPRVFDRYFRGPGERDAHPGGSGLGLSIVRGIMQLHGGTAAVASSGAGGTRITLTFPTAAGRT